jgi:hypothetical protein
VVVVVSVDHAGSGCCWVLDVLSPSDWLGSEIVRKVRRGKDSRGEYPKFIFILFFYMILWPSFHKTIALKQKSNSSMSTNHHHMVVIY